MKYKTEQEEFWAGKFGNDYIDRNKDVQNIASNLFLFSNALKNTSAIKSIIEFGANVGLNLLALHNLFPKSKISAVEINKLAYSHLNKYKWIKAYNESILDFSAKEKYNLVFTKGVLIHISPNELDKVYKKLFELSNKYILIAEYYNPTPVELNYRDNKGKLFKRDFCGDLLKKYSSLELIDYGFIYHRDNNFPQDDLNWFLIRKGSK